MSHMVADTEEELHAMADKISLQRKWYQGDHYDVSLSLRKRAVEHGAREIELRTLACMCAIRRETGKLGDPETAVAIRQSKFKADREALERKAA